MRSGWGSSNMAINGPSTKIIKQLFAESGNLCAFPKCSSPLVTGKMVLGEICHIKAQNLTGARFDNSQTDEDRHSFDNIILLCPTHHKVVDDDEESYSAERLVKMKADHASRTNSGRFASDLESLSAIFVTDQINSSNQSGGVTAHTINATTLNVQSPQTGSFAQRRLEAIEILWNAILTAESTNSPLLLVHRILSPSEIQQDIEVNSGEKLKQLGAWMYASEGSFGGRANLDSHSKAARQEPFVPAAAYKYYMGIFTLISRLGALLYYSLKSNRYHDWMTDEHTQALLRLHFTQLQIETSKAQKYSELQWLLDTLKRQFRESLTELSS